MRSDKGHMKSLHDALVRKVGTAWLRLTMPVCREPDVGKHAPILGWTEFNRIKSPRPVIVPRLNHLPKLLPLICTESWLVLCCSTCKAEIGHTSSIP
jgi:hypothetical protein